MLVMPPRWTVKLALVLTVVLMALAMALPALAGPRVPVRACNMYGDMAVGARALAVESIAQDKAKKIMGYWYPMEHPLVRPIADAILREAYHNREDPRAFANAFMDACVADKAEEFLGLPVGPQSQRPEGRGPLPRPARLVMAGR